MNSSQIPVSSLRFGFGQIPDEGMQMRFEEDFQSLWKDEDLEPEVREELEKSLVLPITGEVEVRKVAAKVDVRGRFSTRVRGDCDRCLEDVFVDLTGDLTTFLMPRKQFSKHDKPGGKVIHRPRRDREASRHRSRSKDEYDLTDTEEDHEDLHFGAFDGVTVDLASTLREALLLSMPMRWICDENCKGLCLQCGGNLNAGTCEESCPGQAVVQG